MRPIKYRGKSKKTGKWIYGNLTKYNQILFHNLNVNETVIMDNIACLQTDNFSYVVNDFSIYPETAGQFTGLLDSKGNEIYEHDLIVSEGVLCEVVYNNQIGAFVLLEVLTQQLGTTPLGEMLETFASEKIGNIHDNTELVFCVKCGTCPHFDNEDAIGEGSCIVNNELKHCTSDACEKWEKKKEGGAE